MTPTEISETYFVAWQAGDFDTLGGLLADDVDFVGALGTASGAADCLTGLRGMSEILERIDVHARVADDSNVITWFDLYTNVAPPAATANWMRIANGKIAQLRVTFDPRGILAASAAA